MYTVVAVYYHRETDHSTRRARSTHKTIGGATSAAAFFAKGDGNTDNHYDVTDEKGSVVFSTRNKEPF